jgi:hypothetical protein
MARLLHLLRSLGPAGATVNARHLLLQRERDDFVVRSLARRVEAAAATALPAPEAARTTTHAA